MHRLVFHYYQRHSSFRSGQAFISFTWNLLWNLLLVLIQAAYVGTGPGEFHDDDQCWQWSVWLIRDTSLVESLSLLHCIGLGKWAVWKRILHRAPWESTARCDSSWTPQVVPFPWEPIEEGSHRFGASRQYYWFLLPVTVHCLRISVNFDLVSSQNLGKSPVDFP